ncbi:CsbD family protein [Streptomyces sp. NPDC002033]|uniref:CsbD family protein n=1 Tax=unclassified Streptomyces TaxID=2593676 RepID=UPI00332192DD
MATGKKVKNVAQKTKGKVKETAGRAVGNQSLESKGAREQMAGDAKQAGQKVKDTLKH